MPGTDKHRDVDYLVTLAQRRLDKGISHEPRGYYDRLELVIDDNVGLFTEGNPDVFRNTEDYPVRITHAAFSVNYFDQASNVDDERNVQLIAANFRFHDQWYMNPPTVVLPVWSNKQVNAVDSVSWGTSSWRFSEGRWTDEDAGGCFVLSARDTLQVNAELIGAPTYPNIAATVTFTGYGIASHRPYMLSSDGDIGAPGTITLNTHDYRNDGGEPILITDMATHISGDLGDGATDPTGDSRRLRINVRQVGNGTNRYWFQGPIAPVPIPQCPSSLLGITSGRAIIHEFPNPLTWEPGQGIGVVGQSVNPGDTDIDSFLNVGLFGYIMIA